MNTSPFEKIEEELEAAVKTVEDTAETVIKKIKKPWYRKAHLWFFIFFFVALIILAYLYFSLWLPIKNSLSLAQQTETQFLQVQEDLLKADFVAAKQDIEESQRLLKKLETNIERLDSPLMISYLRSQYEGTQSMVNSIKEFSNGLYLITDFAQDVLVDIQRDSDTGNLSINPEQRRTILEKFSQQTPELNGAKAQIDLSLVALDQVSSDQLNPALATYRSELRAKLIILRNFLDKAVSLSQTLPTLLGLNSEKTYLFLLENNNELRPTGGFIGTVGILKIKDGNIVSFQTNNVYDYDQYAINRLKINPPAPISKYMDVNYWYLRDSNWSPDFSVAASQIEYFYHQEAALSGNQLPNHNINGIIAITPKIIEEFLSIAGAVEVNSFIFNKDNFVDQLQYLVEVGYRDQNVSFSERKDIIGILSQKLIARTENLNFQGWLEIFKSLFNNLNQKHILIYSKDQTVQSNLELENWSGKIKETSGDYLAVFDANLGALKSNQCVTRDLTYRILPNSENNLLKARVDIHYTNKCSFTWKSTRYRTYTRIYVPLGSEWIKTEGSMDNDRSSQPGITDISEDLNKTVFGTFVAIEPDEEGTLSFEYYLPPEFSHKIFDGNEYSLYLQKQPGTLADTVKLELVFPDKIDYAYPGEEQNFWNDNKYQLSTNLEEDREFQIGF